MTISRLKFHPFIAVSLPGNGKEQIGLFADVVAFVVDHAVAEQILGGEMVPVAVQAELQPREPPDRLLEDFGHVVVELFGIRLGVHDHDGLFGPGGEAVDLTFEKVEVRDGRVVVELQRIGVQADEAHVAGREGKIDLAENLGENPLAGSQTVVVAQQDDVRNIQTIEDVALPLELVAHAEIGQIARVDHEVDVIAGVDGFHGIFGLVVPPLRVADLRETDRPPALARRLDAGDVAGVDTRRTVDAGIVGVVFDLAGGQEYSGQKRKEFGFHNGCFTDCNRKLLGEHPTCALKKTPKND